MYNVVVTLTKQRKGIFIVKKKIIAFVCASIISLSAIGASAQGFIPDHRGTSMEGFEFGTTSVNSNVKSYFELFEKYGNQYGIDPNLLAAICQQESSGINWSHRADGSEMPAWGIMQIENSNAKAFAKFGLETTGVEWTLEDRLDPEKSIAFAAMLVAELLVAYDCDYLKTIQGYNFGQPVLDRIIAEKGDEWLEERENAADYVQNWPYETYGDKLYIERVLGYYRPYMIYKGAKVRVDDELVVFKNQWPIIENERTLIPVRGLFEKLGAKVKWDEKTYQATISYGNTTVIIPIGESYTYVNGKQTEIDTPARLVNGRTMVPLRFVMDSLGFDVEWDEETRTVNVRR